MAQILDQLGLNKTFFYQFAIFAVLYPILARVYFKPFLKLFEIRHNRTVADRAAAEKLAQQAEARFEEYKKRLAAERAAARMEFDAVMNQAKKEEADLLAHAREEAKRITQEAAESVTKQREQLKKQLEADTESLARGVSERLLSRKV